ncbi:hypothetical protein ABT095_11010 [Kitasatospora sp. NPDC002227]|uniref:hypothetical protein n=1 Tax=Kitasatospora sp. NPDC002227 TaxID=3154773 RepID=UPI00332FA1E1
MARRGGDLEAFTAFCLGGTAAFLSWLGCHGLAAAHALPEPLHGYSPLAAALIGLACTVTAYRTLRAPAPPEVQLQLTTLRTVKAAQDAKLRLPRARGPR